MNVEISQQRAAKLEETYVHQVYSRQALSYDNLCDEPWPEIRTFLMSLPSGSLVADVGCGNGKYLNVREDIFINGSDICKELAQLAYKRHRDVIRANNLRLPYRNESMDAVISVGVLHHFASPKRRLQSVKELARILKIGGKLLIYVWAWEQKQRKFKAQDVLVPWSRSAVKDCNSSRRTTKSDGERYSPNLPTNRMYFNNKSNRRMKNGHSSSLEQDSECLTDFSGKGSVQLALSIDRIPDLTINGDEFHENMENKFSKLSPINTSLTDTVATIRENLQKLSFTKLKATPDDNNLENCVVNSQHNGSQSFSRDRNNCSRIGETEEWFSNITFPMKCQYRSLPEYSDSSGLAKKTIFEDKTSKIVDETYSSTVTSLQTARFRRFYHVFRKDELLELVTCVPELDVVSQYYDHGNWVVIAVKQSNNKMEF